MEKIQISSAEQKFNWGEFKVYGERRKTLRHKTLGAGVHVVSCSKNARLETRGPVIS